MNIRQVSKKIKSVNNVKKITKAMQLVSAVKMKKAQQSALEAIPYQKLLEEALKKIGKNLDKSVSPLLSVPEKPVNKKLIILITTNKGLCGSFNFNLLRFIMRNTNIKETAFVTVGKKGATLISQMKGKLIADFSSSYPLHNVSAVSSFILNAFLDNEYEEISLIYNSFISSLRYDPVEEILLPFVPKPTEEEEVFKGEGYTIEPSPEAIIDSLLRSYVEERIRFSITQSEAGEHSARMIAMQNATDNALSIVDGLTLLKNKLRQQKITYELLDMVTAKESVEIL